jgi:hypothetical protein
MTLVCMCLVKSLGRLKKVVHFHTNFLMLAWLQKHWHIFDRADMPHTVVIFGAHYVETRLLWIYKFILQLHFTSLWICRICMNKLYPIFATFFIFQKAAKNKAIFSHLLHFLLALPFRPFWATFLFLKKGQKWQKSKVMALNFSSNLRL